MAQKENPSKADPIKEAFLLRAQWKKADICRQQWQDRWSWLLDERKKTKEEADAVRREAVETTHLPVEQKKFDKTLKPVPPTTAGMVGWLASRDDCQLEVYTSWLTQIPQKMPDAWENPKYLEAKKT